MTELFNEKIKKRYYKILRNFAEKEWKKRFIDRKYHLWKEDENQRIASGYQKLDELCTILSEYDIIKKDVWERYRPSYKKNYYNYHKIDEILYNYFLDWDRVEDALMEMM